MDLKNKKVAFLTWMEH
ncbi:Protein of unknown function [Lactobacillus helveticus CIRM-BIA 101]|nr:Protein of unknown function [Lactobacillus helveticus CIRM-BIA 103]CDI66065.1 Protein of unknown function [Lactobacillus helveticus CIRM-BIA 101]